jgi:putative spermidine/putrescine transport system ATP-binding protein
MDAGRIVQIGTPSEIYDRPTTRFVAAFVGTMNFLPAALEGRNRVRIGRIVVPIAGAHGYSDDAQVVAAVRPEDITLTPTTDDADGTVSRVVFLGSVRRVHVKFGRHDIMADIPGSDERTSTLRLGAAVRVGFVPLKVLLFDRQDQGDS